MTPLYFIDARPITSDNMYATIFELPSQVRNSFDEKDQQRFLEYYNGLNPKTKEEVKDALKRTWHACSKLPSSFSFEIIASADDVDNQREVINIDSVKKHMDAFLDAGGNIMHEHGDYNVGTVYDWVPVKLSTPKGEIDAVKVWGNIFGNNEVTRTARKNFIKGTNSLSIAGEATPGVYKCDNHGCAVHRDVRALMEISLCTVPSNHHCKMLGYHDGGDVSGFAKSQSKGEEDDMYLKIENVTIHKSYDECPISGLKKLLSDVGFDAHSTEMGVIVKMCKDDYIKSIPYIKSCNLSHIWVGDGVLLNDRKQMAELSFKKGYSEGYVDKNGRILPSIKKSDFTDMMERDVLCKDENGYYISFYDDPIR